MLAPVTLAEQWREIEARLPHDWAGAQVTLIVAEDERVDDAALLLAPLTPGRTGSSFRLQIRRGFDAGRVLGRLDEERIRGRLDLMAAGKPADAAAARARPERAPG